MKRRSSFVASSCCSARPGPETRKRVQVDDQGGEDHAEHRDHDEGEHRGGHDRVRRLPVVPLEVPHELRDERRGEDPADEQLVDDVRRLVGVRVDAGDRGDAERVRDRRDAAGSR